MQPVHLEGKGIAGFPFKTISEQQHDGPQNGVALEIALQPVFHGAMSE